MWITGDQSDADFVLRDRSDIDLALRAPVQFHAIAPRRDAVVSPEGKARPIAAITVKTGPTPHQRMTSVGSDDPARVNYLLPQQDTVRMQAGHGSPTPQRNSNGLRPGDHEAV